MKGRQKRRGGGSERWPREGQGAGRFVMYRMGSNGLRGFEWSDTSLWMTGGRRCWEAGADPETPVKRWESRQEAVTWEVAETQ